MWGRKAKRIKALRSQHARDEAALHLIAEELVDARDMALTLRDRCDSPPCQDHSPLRSRAGEHGTGWMLQATLDRLASQPAVWVVENVSSAHNRADFLLCGEMFDLRTVRHRRFTIDPRFSALLALPSHGRHRRPTSTKNRIAALAEGHNLSITGNVGVHAGPPCMGIDWMTGDELSQAIPPAYTQFIGEQLLAAIREGAPA